jgi:hypothetical protein
MAIEPGGLEGQEDQMERERESNSPNLKKYPAKICPAAEEPTETDVGKGWAHM